MTQKNKPKYTYTYTESSVDVKEWSVNSDIPLDEEAIQDMCLQHGFHMDCITHIQNEEPYSLEDNISIEHLGTEFGDDTQTEVYGGLN
tara:strand:+ start:85 stop:348 length:264 start_codon:yes stop_codon:yes gene_type:complete